MKKIQAEKIRCKKFKNQRCLKCEYFVVNYIGIWWSMKMWCCNCMGKHTRSEFFQKKHTFLHFCTFFCKKNEGIAQRNNWDSWENDGFYNTWAAWALMKKTLPAVSKKYTFQRNYPGKQEGKSARGRGVGALLIWNIHVLTTLLIWLHDIPHYYIPNPVFFCILCPHTLR